MTSLSILSNFGLALPLALLFHELITPWVFKPLRAVHSVTCSWEYLSQDPLLCQPSLILYPVAFPKVALTYPQTPVPLQCDLALPPPVGEHNSPPPNQGWIQWLVHKHRMWRKWCCMTLEAKSKEALQLIFILVECLSSGLYLLIPAAMVWKPPAFLRVYMGYLARKPNWAQPSNHPVSSHSFFPSRHHGAEKSHLLCLS